MDGPAPSQSLADQILRDHARLEAVRAEWDTLFRSIAERVMPRADVFQRDKFSQAELRMDRVFDSTAILACERASALIQSLLIPRNTKWAKLMPGPQYLAEDDATNEYLEEINRRLFALRYAPDANFSNQGFEHLMSLMAFGTGAMFVDETLKGGFRYRAVHLSEIVIGEDFQGRIDRVHRKFGMTAYQAMQAFEPDSLPQNVREAASHPQRMWDSFDIVHCVKPNQDYDPRRVDGYGKAIGSYYVFCEGRTMAVQKGKKGIAGYRTQPYCVSRYMTGPGEVYGRSPAMSALADIRVLNEMNKTVLRAGQLAVDPPWIGPDDGSLAPFNPRPGAYNAGYMTDDGRQLVQSMQSGARLDIGLEMIQDRRQAVNDAFLISLFQVLVDRPNQTATEALLRAQEKGQLIGPTVDRQQTEWLGPMIVRELDLATEMGLFEDLEMPEALIEAGGEIEISYENPINRMQNTDEAVGLLRMLEALTPLAQIKPEVLDVVDVYEAARVFQQANGVPAKAVLSREQFDALRQERAQVAEAERLAAAIPGAARAARDLAQTQATAGNAPQPIPFVEPGVR